MRQKLYYEMAAAGLTYKQIALMLNCSPACVGNVLHRLAKKTGKSLLRMMMEENIKINPDWRLTKQEQNVLCQLATGASNTEIAQVLNISPGTVSVHLVKIYRKLGVQNRRQAIAKVRHDG